MTTGRINQVTTVTPGGARRAPEGGGQCPRQGTPRMAVGRGAEAPGRLRVSETHNRAQPDQIAPTEIPKLRSATGGKSAITTVYYTVTYAPQEERSARSQVNAQARVLDRSHPRRSR